MYGLDGDDERIVRSILAPYAGTIERVALFGSRATGAARPNSDIDLVLYGELTDADVDRLWTLFDDSALSVGVDLIRYRDDMYPPLRAHIERVARPLFARSDLASADAPARRD